MRIGVVGIGYQGKKIVRELHKMNVDVVMCDVLEKVRYKSYWKMEELESLDGVVVAVPNEKHIEIGDYFVRKRVPVLMEKPLTKRFDSANALLNLAKLNKCVLATGSVFSFNNSVKTVGEIIKAELLGKLEFVKCSWCSQMEPWAERDILLDLCPHVYDILYSWNLEPEQNYGRSTLMEGKHVLIFADSKLTETNIEMKLSWVEGPKRREVKVVGEKYILVVDVLNQDVFVYEGNELVAYKTHTKGLSKKGFDLQFSRNNTLKSELEDFIMQIEGKPKYKLAEQGVRFLKWKESKGGEL